MWKASGEVGEVGYALHSMCFLDLITTTASFNIFTYPVIFLPFTLLHFLYSYTPTLLSASLL